MEKSWINPAGLKLHLKGALRLFWHIKDNPKLSERLKLDGTHGAQKRIKTPQHTKNGFKTPEALQNKAASMYIQTQTQMHQQAQQFDTSSVYTLPQAGLWVPAVGRLVPRLLYLCLKGAALVKLRP